MQKGAREKFIVTRRGEDKGEVYGIQMREYLYAHIGGPSKRAFIVTSTTIDQS